MLIRFRLRLLTFFVKESSKRVATLGGDLWDDPGGLSDGDLEDWVVCLPGTQGGSI